MAEKKAKRSGSVAIDTDTAAHLQEIREILEARLYGAKFPQTSIVKIAVKELYDKLLAEEKNKKSEENLDE
ncbi:hypothetical protein ACULLB_09925 [Enterococcus gallinarum]|uniref:hypothetical protein n=1 Tax=Enterococcus gallinarum TaxID=1353 RepID=UPI003BF888D5